MTRQVRTQKNDGVGEARDFGRVGIDVVAHTDVQARQTDPRAMLNALGSWERQLMQQGAENIAARNELSGQEGMRDATLNRVDEERMKDDAAYSKGVAKNRTAARGYEWLAKSNVDLDAALKDDPNLDFEAWREGRLKEFLGSADAEGTLAIEDQNRFVAQFEQTMRARYEAKHAQIKLQEQTTSFADAMSSLLRATGGKLTPEQLATAEKQYGDENAALDEDERADVFGTLLLQQLGTDKNLNAYELAKSRGLLDKADWADKFERQKEATTQLIEREREEAIRNDMDRYMRVTQDLNRKARNGELTMAYLSKLHQSGEATDAEVRSAWNTQLSYENQRYNTALKEREKAQHRAQLGAIALKGQAAIEVAIGTGVGTRKEFKALFDQQWALAQGALLSGEDPAEAKKAMEATMVIAQQAAIMPDGAKNFFEKADVSTPAFETHASLYREMKADGFADYFRNALSSAAYAKLERWDKFVAGGMSKAEATRKLASSVIPVEEAVKRTAQMQWRTITPAAKELSADLDVVTPAVVENMLATYVSGHIAAGLSDDEALEAAKQEFNDRIAVIDGFPVPRMWLASETGGAAEQLAESWPRYRDEVLMPELTKRYGTAIGELRLEPNLKKPGRFVVRPVGHSTVIKEWEDDAPDAEIKRKGKPKEFTVDDILMGVVRLERGDVDKQRELEALRNSGDPRYMNLKPIGPK
jgi:t-SNARE complex subunit (syntaxin)